MAEKSIIKRDQSFPISLCKLFIDSSNATADNGELFLPVLPLPSNLLNFSSLKVINLDGHRGIIAISMQTRSTLGLESNLSLFTIDGKDKGSLSWEWLASAKADEYACAFLGSL